MFFTEYKLEKKYSLIELNHGPLARKTDVVSTRPLHSVMGMMYFYISNILKAGQIMTNNEVTYDDDTLSVINFEYSAKLGYCVSM